MKLHPSILVSFLIISTGCSRSKDHAITAYQNSVRAIITETPIRTDSLLDERNHTDDPYLKQAILSRLKNELVTSEYNIVNYCSQRFAIHSPIICEFLPTAFISNTRVRKGDTIQLWAWMGDMYTRTGLEIQIHRQRPARHLFPPHPNALQQARRDDSRGRKDLQIYHIGVTPNYPHLLTV